jgi:hypothetical protein
VVLKSIQYMYTRMGVLNRNVDRGRFCKRDRMLFDSVSYVQRTSAVLQVLCVCREPEDCGRMNELE